MSAGKTFYNANSKAINVGIQIILLLLTLACYILYVILFVRPAFFHLPSLLTPLHKGLKPTTAVTLISAVLVAATSTLVTRAVEQSLWIKLASRSVGKPMTAKESHMLAQWSVSPLGRLGYAFSGRYMTLRVAGPLLVAAAIVSPVLISGIAPSTSGSSSERIVPASMDPWTGYLDAANENFNGGDMTDVPNEVAALAYLNGLAVPASDICIDSMCSLIANGASINAAC
ncbi:hypothetical protein L207DRAFT_589808 [Hyaloscypha variabilis F]|uniref:Uncharacterized protein n=1 Tax=Hyaloscypha variabilis (strain UAMH 11265 / GT02V1 / F) TaxID=1149755 RepID=A0A2J6R4J7_HYAVF|nr:hypothetical protein L207DRAFT_589808 [Hyaloscypha variabilis F]